MSGNRFVERAKRINEDTQKVSMSLKVDRYGNVYAAPLGDGERALSFDEVSAIAASRR